MAAGHRQEAAEPSETITKHITVNQRTNPSHWDMRNDEHSGYNGPLGENVKEKK